MSRCPPACKNVNIAAQAYKKVNRAAAETTPTKKAVSRNGSKDKTPKEAISRNRTTPKQAGGSRRQQLHCAGGGAGRTCGGAVASHLAAPCFSGGCPHPSVLRHQVHRGEDRRCRHACQRGPETCRPPFAALRLLKAETPHNKAKAVNFK